MSSCLAPDKYQFSSITIDVEKSGNLSNHFEILKHSQLPITLHLATLRIKKSVRVSDQPCKVIKISKINIKVGRKLECKSLKPKM